MYVNFGAGISPFDVKPACPARWVMSMASTPQVKPGPSKCQHPHYLTAS